MRRRAVEFLREIIQIQSVNPPGNERDVAIALKGLLDQYRIENRLIDLGNNRANLIACLRGENRSPNKRILALSGHMDVVPPGQLSWEHDPFSCVIKGGKLYGRGASDMKGGLVGLVFAMLELKEEGARLGGDVKLLASAGEETGAFGAKQFFESGQMDDVTALLIAEPTRGDVVVAHKGALWVEVTCYGKTAHGSMPDLGVNAIIHMNRFLNAFFDTFRMMYNVDEMLGHPTFNVAVIEGGVKTNMVPDQCRVQIDFRTVPSQRHEQILCDLQLLIDNLYQEDTDCRAEIQVLNDLSAVGTPADHPFVQTVCVAAKEIFGCEPIIRGMNGYTDAAVLAPPERPIPLVIIGGGDERLAHQPNEYIEIDAFLRSIDLYKSIIRKYLGTY